MNVPKCHIMCQSIVNFSRIFHILYLYHLKIIEESIIVYKNNIHYEQSNKKIHESWS